MRRSRRSSRPAARLLAVLWACAAAGSGAGTAETWPWKNAPETFTLAGGVPCIYQKDASSPTTVVGLIIGGGRAAVPAGLDGLAALSTRLLLEIPDEGKAGELMSQATRLSFVCLEDHSIVLVECLTGNLEAALKVTAKIVLDPLISGLRVGRARELMEINGRADDDDAVTAGRQAVFRGLFGAGGYGTSLFGTKRTLEAIDRKTVLSFVRRFVVRPNVFFCVQSDLDRDPVRRLLEASFRPFPEGPAAALPPQMPALPPDRDIALVRESKQTYIGRAFVLPRTGPADMAKGLLLETLLGRGPGSRLWGLREDEGLAYGVEAELTWTKSAGVLIARLETGPDKSARAAAALDRALGELRDGGPGPEELEAAKIMARAGFLRETEAKAPRLRRLGQLAVLGLGEGSVPDLLGATGGVTLESLKDYVREVLDPALAVRVTIGPAPPPAPRAP
jgi:zinc protease